MKWYSAKKFRPGFTGDQIIIRLKTGYIHGGSLDHQNDSGYFVENAEHSDRYFWEDITHFCIPDPIEIDL